MTVFLVARPTDLVVLGLRWSGFRLLPGAPVLEATGDASWLVVTFPPQHIVEQAFATNLDDPGPAATRLAGPSQIAFIPGAVAGGREPARVLMTVEGVLEALRNGRILGGDGGPPDGHESTVIEIPWRMMWSPQAATGSEPVTCQHPTRPQISRMGDVGLWHTRLGIRGGHAGRDTAPAGLALRTVDPGVAGLDDPIGGIPLSRDARTSIVQASATASPAAARLELSSLGGSLTAHGVWDNLEWDHETTLGRDQLVRVLRSGVLYPFGHRAVFVELTQRRFNPDAARSVAALRGRRTLIVTEPIRGPVTGGTRLERAFPFSEVEITQSTFADLGEPEWHNQPVPSVFFWPRSNDLSLVRFPVRCTGTNGDIHFRLPMIFVNDLRPTFASLTDPLVAADLQLAWETPREDSLPGVVDLPGVAIDLVRSASPAKSDIQEVQQLSLVGAATPNDGSFRPSIDGLRVALPELRTLVGEAAPADVAVQFDEHYLAVGDAAKVALHITGNPILVDFTSQADRSGGLVAPKFDFDGISREYGPVQVAGLLSAGPDGFLDPSQLFGLGATLLGFDLRSVVRDLREPPTIVSDLAADRSLAVTMTWEEVKVELQELGENRRPPNTTLKLEVFNSPERTSTTCTVRNVSLILPTPDTPLLELSFESVIFTQVGAKEPQLEVHDLGVEFLGLLQLLKKLQDAVDLGDSAPNIEASRDGVTAGYALPVPTVETGAFILRNIVLRAEVDVPFHEDPVAVTLGFADRANPFNVSVLMFGGGGYVEVKITKDGLERLEASLEFGASVAVNFLIASAEVHALGGVRYVMESTDVILLTGFIRIGGSVDILGLISVSIELVVTLTYDQPNNRMIGRATLVVEIDLTLYSDSVELDTGDWVLVGDPIPAGQLGPSHDELMADRLEGSRLDSDIGRSRSPFDEWKRYREALARP